MLFLVGREFSFVPEGVSRFYNILLPTLIEEPSYGLPKDVAVPAANNILLLRRMVLQLNDDKILLLLKSTSWTSLIIS
jgi:hypothetical protein